MKKVKVTESQLKKLKNLIKDNSPKKDNDATKILKEQFQKLSGINEQFGFSDQKMSPKDDPTKEEMISFLDSEFENSEQKFDQNNFNFDKEEAIYWFAHDYHGGQNSNLYSALSTSKYKPGSLTNGPENSREMYDALVSKFGGEEERNDDEINDEPLDEQNVAWGRHDFIRPEDDEQTGNINNELGRLETIKHILLHYNDDQPSSDHEDLMTRLVEIIRSVALGNVNTFNEEQIKGLIDSLNDENPYR